MKQVHFAKKQFGQNFLTDPYYLEKIVQAISPSSEDALVEIGPGQGALTDFLVAAKPLHLDLIELDRDLIPALQRRFDQPFVKIIAQDALTVDYQSLVVDNRPLKVVGNLPYNISTPLLFHLASFGLHISEMVFLLQKEVVDRICAVPKTSEYGRLSIMLQSQMAVSSFVEVPPEAFDPPPKVMSKVVRLTPRKHTALKDFDLLSAFTAKAFSARRKIIKKAISAFAGKDLDDFEPWLGLRPEEISVEDFVKIANLLYDMKNDQ